LAVEAEDKPSFYVDEIVRYAYKLFRVKNPSFEDFYEPIREWGKAPLKVFFVLYMQDGWMSAEEIRRVSSLKRWTVFDALKILGAAGYLEKAGSMYRLIPKYRKKI